MKYAVIFFDLGDTLVVSGKSPSDKKKWLPGALELITKLKHDGTKLGIISNTGTYTRKQMAKLLPDDFNWQLFDESLIILSSEVQVEKPAAEIFRKAITKSGLKPSECLFITEDAMDCLVAQQVGMHAYRVQTPPASDTANVFAALEKLKTL